MDHAPYRAGELESALARDRAGSWGPRQSEVATSYFRARGFKNGNAHLWLTRDDLVEKVNKELAAYHGAALADAAPDTARPQDYKPAGTAFARDLAFHPTPAAAVDALMDRLHIAPARACWRHRPGSATSSVRRLRAAPRSMPSKSILAAPMPCLGSATRPARRLHQLPDHAPRAGL